eukprot:TRINITY_DN7407_c0_g1_i1.p1 TRINITY_DN7407_c0_g1~~TRINITY_DN7407_c0_g1_i1.p1  ORF type:complete len:1113 (+),score=178.96 TRINITY_DN7407_c0_g1_i1:477-3815(+)
MFSPGVTHGQSEKSFSAADFFQNQHATIENSLQDLLHDEYSATSSFPSGSNKHYRDTVDLGFMKDVSMLSLNRQDGMHGTQDLCPPSPFFGPQKAIEKPNSSHRPTASTTSKQPLAQYNSSSRVDEFVTSGRARTLSERVVPTPKSEPSVFLSPRAPGTDNIILLSPLPPIEQDAKTGFFLRGPPTATYPWFEGTTMVKKNTWRSRYIKLDEGVIIVRKKGNKSADYRAKAADLTISHVCHTDVDKLRPFQFSIYDGTTAYFIAAESPEQLDLWLTALHASKIQSLIYEYQKKYPQSFADYISKEELDVYEATIRALIRHNHLSSSDMTQIAGQLTSIFQYDPRRNEILQRIVRASSWTYSCTLLHQLQSMIVWNHYYKPDTLRDQDAFQRYCLRQNERMADELNLMHASCAPSLELTRLDKYFLTADYHIMFRRLLEKVYLHENPKLVMDNPGHLNFQHAAEFSNDAYFIIHEFCSYYGLSECYENIVYIDCLVRTISPQSKHLTMIADRLEFLYSRFPTKSTQANAIPITTLEVAALKILCCNKLFRFCDSRIQFFTAYFSNNEPSGSIREIIRILKMISFMFPNPEKNREGTEEGFTRVLTEYIKASVQKSCDKMISAIESMPIDQEQDKTQDQPGIPKVLSPIRLFHLVLLVKTEVDNLDQYEDEFPSHIDYRAIAVKKYMAMLLDQALFTAHTYGTGSNSDPSFILLLCSTWKELQGRVSSYMIKGEKLIPIESLFEDGVIRWIDDIGLSIIQWTEKACDIDDWEPKVEKQFTSSSLVDTFSALGENLDCLMKSLAQDAVFESRRVGVSFMERYSLKSCQVVKIYASLVHKRVRSHFKVESMIGQLETPIDKLIIQLNNLSECRQKLHDFLSVTLGDQRSYTQSSLNEVDISNFEVDSLETAIDEDVRATFGVLKQILEESVISFVDWKFTHWVTSVVLITKAEVKSITKEGTTPLGFSFRSAKKEVERNQKESDQEYIFEKKKEEHLARSAQGYEGMSRTLAILFQRLTMDVLLRVLKAIWCLFVQKLDEIVRPKIHFNDDLYLRHISTIRIAMEVMRDFLHEDGNGLPLSFAQKDIDSLFVVKDRHDGSEKQSSKLFNYNFGGSK